jgi:simple sugar transport system permease protein
MIDFLVLITVSIVIAATPMLFAAVGELVAERSGVLNLGVEGMMLIGAVVGFGVTMSTGSAILGIGSAALAGAALALVFAVLVLTLMANQVATGLALTIFGIGLSALIGAGFVGMPIAGLPKLNIPVLSTLPIIGPLFFQYDAMVYLSIALTFAVGWFLKRTHAGMVLRAVGESAESAHSIGHPVIGVRYLATLFGGAMAGLGGAFLSLSVTPMWAENMTSGRGWIALALVVFGSWRPGRVLLGAYIFGGVTILQLHAQGSGSTIGLPSQVFTMLPYLATIAVLTIISAGPWRGRFQAPACLGQSFRPSV